MKRLATLFTRSCEELRQVKTITVCAMLAAAAVVLSSFSIYVTDTVRVGFSGIPNQLAASLFGPAVASLFAGALDLIKYMLRPSGAFFPGFTLVTMLAGLIYGCFFYGKQLTLPRVLAAHFVVALVCNVLLNTWCLTVITGKGFWILVHARAVKNLIMWPVDSLVFCYVARLLKAAGVFRLLRQAGG